MTGYPETYRCSLERPEEFWAEAAEAIDWERRWDRVLDASRPPFYRWFAGGRLNTCWNAVDRHVAAGRGERVALIWDSPVTGQVRHFTYLELQSCCRGTVSRAHGHHQEGVGSRSGWAARSGVSPRRPPIAPTP